jgi:membrane protein implicated in regulation of membrane protease activity
MSHGHAPFGTLSSVALRTTAWFVSPLAVAAFALLFGGTGACLAVLLPASAAVLIFVLACAMGVVGFAGIKALMALFVRSSSPPLSRDAMGSEGTLVFGIKVNEKGEQLAGQVQYEVEGLWRTTLAHTENNIALQRGTRVRIVGRDPVQGVVIVEAIDPLDELPAAQAAIPVSR